VRDLGLPLVAVLHLDPARASAPDVDAEAARGHHSNGSANS
jgi:hypothetical protein